MYVNEFMRNLGEPWKVKQKQDRNGLLFLKQLAFCGTYQVQNDFKFCVLLQVHIFFRFVPIVVEGYAAVSESRGDITNN